MWAITAVSLYIVIASFGSFWLIFPKLLISLLVSCSCHNKYQKAATLKQKKFMFRTLLEVGRPNQYHQIGPNQDVGSATFPPGTLGENLFFVSPSFWWLHHSILGLFLPITFSPVYVFCVCLVRIHMVTCKNHRILDDTFLLFFKNHNLITSFAT